MNTVPICRLQARAFRGAGVMPCFSGLGGPGPTATVKCGKRPPPMPSGGLTSGSSPFLPSLVSRSILRDSAFSPLLAYQLYFFSEKFSGGLELAIHI